MRGPFVCTQVEAGADMLSRFSHLPCSLLISAFQGEKAKLWPALVICSPVGVLHPDIPEAFGSTQVRYCQTSPSDREQQSPAAVGIPILSL